MANSIGYGFVTLQDIFADRVMDNIPIVQTAVEESIAEYQRQMTAMLSMLVAPVTTYQERYRLPGSTTLQPLDQYGNPLPIVPTGYYDVAYPIQSAGIAWGDNRVSRAKMTVADANRLTMTVMNADMDWMARHMLAAIFTNTTWTYADEDHGDLTIQPLAIASDNVVYVRKGGASATDTHYLAQANAIGNADNPFPAIYDELAEHPSNAGPYVAYIPTNLKTAVMALDDFVEINDPDINLGANASTVVGSIAQGFGDEVLGKANKMWIVEWKRLPDSYILALAQGASDPILGMRQHAEPELQGLFPEFQNIDGNRFLNKFIRMCGFGVRNRVGAVVYRIGNSSYAIPSGYTAPLPV